MDPPTMYGPTSNEFPYERDFPDSWRFLLGVLYAWLIYNVVVNTLYRFLKATANGVYYGVTHQHGDEADAVVHHMMEEELEDVNLCCQGSASILRDDRYFLDPDTALIVEAILQEEGIHLDQYLDRLDKSHPIEPKKPSIARELNLMIETPTPERELLIVVGEAGATPDFNLIPAGLSDAEDT